MAKRRGMLLGVVACVIIVVVGLVGLLRPQSDPPRHVFEEMHQVLTTDRPGPLAEVEHLEPYRISNNRESKSFQYYGYRVKEGYFPESFTKISYPFEEVISWSYFIYRLTDDVYILCTFTYSPKRSESVVTFRMVGKSMPDGTGDVVPSDVVIEELAKLGLTPEDVEQEIFDVFNEFYIGPWTEVYDSAFSVDDWGELTINNEGLWH